MPYLQPAEVWLEGKNFYFVFEHLCNTRLFPEKGCNEQNNYGREWKVKQGNDGEIRVT